MNFVRLRLTKNMEISMRVTNKTSKKILKVIENSCKNVRFIPFLFFIFWSKLNRLAYLDVFFWLGQHQNAVFIARYELRRCVRARTRAMHGRTCACACKIHSGKCVGCACLRHIFGRAMFDLTFAHFWNKIARKCYSIMSNPVLKHLFLL